MGRILQDPDPRLREIASPCVLPDESVALLALTSTMRQVLESVGGIGLAAPQLGVSKRVIVLLVERKFRVMVNPLIVEADAEMVTHSEGCLSVGYGTVRDYVRRYRMVKVQWCEIEGVARSGWVSGLLAAAVQHEVDHLDGVLFVDRVRLQAVE